MATIRREHLYTCVYFHLAKKTRDYSEAGQVYTIFSIGHYTEAIFIERHIALKDQQGCFDVDPDATYSMVRVVEVIREGTEHHAIVLGCWLLAWK